MEEKNLFIKVEKLFNEGLSVAQVVIELGEENKKHIAIYYAKLKRLNKKKNKEGIFNVDEFENWII
jgi:hypothetical protein